MSSQHESELFNERFALFFYPGLRLKFHLLREFAVGLSSRRGRQKYSIEQSHVPLCPESATVNW